MKYMMIAAVVVAGMIGTMGAAEFKPHQDIKQELTSYVREVLRVSPKRQLNYAINEAVPAVVKHSILSGLDPLLIGSIISSESAWTRNAIGKIGEVGLMQVNNRDDMKGFDMRTADGQVGAGVKVLSRCMENCDNEIEALNAFRTGKCLPVRTKTKERYELYIQAIRDHREDFSDWKQYGVTP